MICAIVLIVCWWLRQMMICGGLCLMTMIRYIFLFSRGSGPRRQTIRKYTNGAAQLHEEQRCAQECRNSNTGFVPNRLHLRF
jgi:hypothetical protein